MNPLKPKRQPFTGLLPLSGLFNIKHFAHITTIILLILTFLALDGCKKGEDDPFFSFRTRRARVEGKWRLQKASVIITTVDFGKGARLNDIFDIADSRFTLTETSSSRVPDIYKGSYIINLDCTKDGSFNLYELFNGKILEATGEWMFNDKSPGKKSKEYINMTIKNTSSGQTSGYFLFNQSSTSFTYRMKELRDKKMVLVVESDIYKDANGLEQTYSGEYTFIQ